MAACACATAARRAPPTCSGGSAPSRCGSRAPPPTCAARSGCASTCSTRRCPPSPAAAARLARRDIDPYDALCDHLLVVDHATPNRVGKPSVVGTYRLLRQDMARAACRLLQRGRVRHRGAAGAPSRRALPRARPLLRAAALSQQAHRRAAVARHLELCAAAPARRDDRLRQPRGHRSGRARAAAVVPASLRARPGGVAGERAAATAGSR